VDGSEHYRGELLYHRKKNLRALDVTNLIEKYDQDMELKHESTVDMTAVYTKEKAELDALSGYFATRDAEERKVAEEHQRIREERTRELHVERRAQQAGLLVQGLYNPYLAKFGPKQPKPKKVKKKKDPFAGLRTRPKSGKADEGGASAVPAVVGGGGESPAASGPEDSDDGAAGGGATTDGEA
jgi:hypothetical protein